MQLFDLLLRHGRKRIKNGLPILILHLENVCPWLTRFHRLHTQDALEMRLRIELAVM